MIISKLEYVRKKIIWQYFIDRENSFLLLLPGQLKSNHDREIFLLIHSLFSSNRGDVSERKYLVIGQNTDKMGSCIS